ncbi:MAG: two-component system, OmpR family, sensor kinase [Solirubrobacteraceae bacterium]|jgi:signal transduction histidine kinase|nr:two-component system, OmpR family, sensor kinase [Solirubrobacteraceae bacterium]
MASPDSFIRSAARATSSAPRRLFAAYRRIPIRWRLAGGSAVLTFVILCGFAAIVGVLTTRAIRDDFNEQVRAAATDLRQRLQVHPGANPTCRGPDLDVYGSADSAQIRVVTLDGALLCRSRGAPDFGIPREETTEIGGYRVESRVIPVPPLGSAVLQYARPLSDVNRTIRKMRVFLLLGVLGGTLLALLAGLATARRAMRPIAELTSAAREIARTRDPSRRLPHPEADDEVAELARTLEEMLMALDAARGDTEAALRRQRTFVADASHELRTPLTSVLANLEVLSEQLGEGELGDAAGSALRSSRRMRRLVADLLLLARTDAGRPAPREPTDLAGVVTEAAAEMGPIAGEHSLRVDAEPAVVDGTRDDLHRLAVNLIENAVRHTPAGTSIEISVQRTSGEVVLAVTDDGPGIDPELADQVFERFVRGAGDRAGSSGLGLAIVRAVAESHGGSVRLVRPDGGGTCFEVRLPAAELAAPEPVPA